MFESSKLDYLLKKQFCVIRLISIGWPRYIWGQICHCWRRYRYEYESRVWEISRGAFHQNVTGRSQDKFARWPTSRVLRATPTKIQHPRETFRLQKLYPLQICFFFLPYLLPALLANLIPYSKIFLQVLCSYGTNVLLLAIYRFKS